MPECFHPREVKLTKPSLNKVTGEFIYTVPVTCGRCENCILRNRMEWSFRLEQEMKASKNAWFVTLTYDEDNVPYDVYGNLVLLPTSLKAKKLFLKVNGKTEIPDKYLKKMKLKDQGFVDRSIQSYFKRLRIRHKRNKEVKMEHFVDGLMLDDKVRFYVTGEYGERLGRPHYHAIIFNACQGFIESEWGFGDVLCVRANSKTIAYCLKYMDKWKDKKQDWKKPPEFSECSLGIGEAWLEKMKEFHKKNLDINYVVNSKNVMVPMPRYYRQRMFTDEEIMLQRGIIDHAVKTAREEEMMKKGFDQYYKDKGDLRKFVKHKFKSKTKKREM